METFFALVITLIITSWIWMPVLFAMSPIISLILVGIRESLPFLRSK